MMAAAPADWLGPDHPGFASARADLSASTWQPDRVPAAVVRVRSADDVVTAIHVAAERDLRVAVRSGGHSLSATHLASGAVTLDLRRLDRIEVDTAAATAWIEPGATVAQVARALDRAAMSYPLGHAPTVGLGGYLLAGGNGWNTPQWGHGCEGVLAAEVVLTDGSRRVVDADHDPDLWRAARGAGPLFPGVVLRFLVQLWRGAATVRRALATTAVRDAAELGARIDDLLVDLDPAVEATIFWRPAHRGQPEPQAMVALTAFDARVDPAEVLRRHGLSATATNLTPLPDVIDALPPHTGDALASDHSWTDASYADVLPRLTMRNDALTDCSSILLTTASRRADGGVPADAVYVPNGSMSVSAYAHWDPFHDAWEPQVAWTREVSDSLADLTTGHYVGEADLMNGPDAVGRCFPPQARTALDETLRRRDPDARMAWTTTALDQLESAR